MHCQLPWRSVGEKHPELLPNTTCHGRTKPWLRRCCIEGRCVGLRRRGKCNGTGIVGVAEAEVQLELLDKGVDVEAAEAAAAAVMAR